MFREKLPNSMLRSILDRVSSDLVAAKAAEPLAELRAKVKDLPATRDFNGALSQEFGLIAEIKRKSPSMGTMRNSDVDQIARIYAGSHAVKAVSVLTNFADFGMTVEHLGRVKTIVHQPILRKDFIFDPYQVWQARAYGADAILLMANVVTKGGLAELFELAESLGLGVLFESHEAAEIRKIPTEAKVYGINSRRFMAGRGKSTRGAYIGSRLLRVFGIRRDLSIDHRHFELAHKLPKQAIKVAESGINPAMVPTLRDELHFDSLLVGTSLLMAEKGVAPALAEFESRIVAAPGSQHSAHTGTLHHATA